MDSALISAILWRGWLEMEVDEVEMRRRSEACVDEKIQGWASQERGGESREQVTSPLRWAAAGKGQRKQVVAAGEQLVRPALGPTCEKGWRSCLPAASVRGRDCEGARGGGSEAEESDGGSEDRRAWQAARSENARGRKDERGRFGCQGATA